MTGPVLVLMCGLPGAGKTTLALSLADKMPAVRLCPDEWMAALEVDLFDEEFRDRLEKQFWVQAQELLRLGLHVILESGFWLRAERDEKRSVARDLGVRVELWFLDVPIDELVRRVEKRNTVPLGRSHLEHYQQFFQAPDPAEQELFDQPATRPESW